jgi:membrane protein
MNSLRAMIPNLNRLRVWFRFHIAEFSTFAAAISYQLMIVFFPGILLIKALKDIFGIPNVARYQPVYAEIDMPGSIVTLVKSFLRSAKGLTGFDKSLATIFLIARVVLGLSRLFAEYYKASLKLFERDRRLFRERLIGGIAAVAFVSVAILLFLALNGTVFSYQPHILRDYGLLIEIISALISFALLVGSVAGLIRLVSHGALSTQAIWGGAMVTVGGWILASLLFLQLDTYFALQQKFYGAGAAIVAMLIWFYLTASLLLAGLGFAAIVIDKRVPLSSDPYAARE